MAAIWHDANYSHRMLITTGTPSAGAGPYVPVGVHSWLTDFWSVVLSTGYDVRFFYGTSGAQQTYNRATWVYADKSAVFNVSVPAGYNGTTDQSPFLWMYWGYASATDGSTVVTTTTAQGAAFGNPQPSDAILARAVDPGAETPATRVAKTTWEARYFWWDITDLLGTSASPQNGRAGAEYGLQSVEWDATAGTGFYVAGVRDPAGAPDTSQAATTAVVIDGRTYVGIYASGGTDGDDYTFALRLFLSAPPSSSAATTDIPVEARALMQVRNPAE